jgi:hypothetical protein
MTRGRSPYPHAAVKAERLFSSGHGAKEVSDKLGVTISRISQWYRNYKLTGYAMSRYGPKDKPFIDCPVCEKALSEHLYSTVVKRFCKAGHFMEFVPVTRFY